MRALQKKVEELEKKKLELEKAKIVKEKEAEKMRLRAIKRE